MKIKTCLLASGKQNQFRQIIDLGKYLQYRKLKVNIYNITMSCQKELFFNFKLG